MRARPDPTRPAYRNHFGVKQGNAGRYPIMGLTPGQAITRDQAVNLAAHLIFFADLSDTDLLPALEQIAAGHPAIAEQHAQAAAAAAAHAASLEAARTARPGNIVGRPLRPPVARPATAPPAVLDAEIEPPEPAAPGAPAGAAE